MARMKPQHLLAVADEDLAALGKARGSGERKGVLEVLIGHVALRGGSACIQEAQGNIPGSEGDSMARREAGAAAASVALPQ